MAAIEPAAAQTVAFVGYVEPPVGPDSHDGMPAHTGAYAASADPDDELTGLRRQLLAAAAADVARLLDLDHTTFWSTVLWCRPGVGDGDGDGDGEARREQEEPPAPTRSSLVAFVDSYLDKRTALVRRLAEKHGHVTDANAASDPLFEEEHVLEQLMFRLAVRLLTPPSIASDAGETPDGAPLVARTLPGGDAEREWTDEAWLAACTATGLLECPRIVEACRLFALANASVMRPLLEHLFVLAPGLLDELSSALDYVLGEINGIQRRRQKASSAAAGGKGKGKGKAASADAGKGKGKGAGHDPGAGGGNTGGSGVNIAEEEAHDELAFLFDLMTTLEAVVCAGGSAVAHAVLGHPRLLQALAGVQDLASMYFVAFTTATGPQSTAAPDVLAVFADAGGDGERNPTARLARRLKRSILSLLHRLITVEFIEPARASVISSPADFERFEAGLCDLALGMLELSAIDGPATYLRDAPLLLDYEIEYSIADELRALIDLQKEHAGAASGPQLDDPLLAQLDATEQEESGPDHARMEYVIMSLEQLLVFSGNAETRRVISRHKQEQAWIERQIDENEVAVVTGGRIQNYSASSGHNEEANEEYVKRTILISHVHDLFPDLGDGFIEACLVAMGDDHELVIMKILEDDLPDHIKRLDRSLPRSAPPFAPSLPARTHSLAVVPVSRQDSILLTSGEETPVATQDTPAPRTPPPAFEQVLASRRNVFDGDEFDVFARGNQVDRSKISIGKTNRASGMEAERQEFLKAAKSRILDTQFEDEDDEYDDTYDSTDIKLAGTVELHAGDEDEGMVDSAPRAPSAAPADPTAPHEAYLVSLYTTDPSVFDQSQRKSAKRAAVRERTGMSDEQIEGWFKMLERNPRRDRVLSKYEWRGNRAPNVLASEFVPTAGSGESTPESDRSSPGGQGRPRGGAAGGANRGGSGGGRGGRGGGGDANRGQGRGRGGGDHHRKDRFARKMAKGMAAPDT